MSKFLENPIAWAVEKADSVENFNQKVLIPIDYYWLRYSRIGRVFFIRWTIDLITASVFIIPWILFMMIVMIYSEFTSEDGGM